MGMRRERRKERRVGCMRGKCGSRGREREGR